MADFFVSYTSADRDWAEWIAFVIEELGFTCVIQAWDFKPGSNFPLRMQEGLAAERMVLVLSPDYLKSGFGAAEWSAAFKEDPTGAQQKLLPVMVRDCQPTGLLSTIVHLRLFELDEDAAKLALASACSRRRAKPSVTPLFPGRAQRREIEFPGDRDKPSAPRTLPKLAVKPTDRDKRQFALDGFDRICRLIKGNAAEATAQEPRLNIDIEMRTSADLRLEAYVDGELKTSCRIWLGAPFSQNSISYVDGRYISDNSYSESLSVEENGGLHFMATMGISFAPRGISVDIKHMSGDQAAQYLWERFVANIY